MKVLLLLGLCLASVGSQSGSWTIRIDSSGGFAGGRGSVLVSSDATVRVTPRSGRSCSSTLTAPELKAMQSAVDRARPSGWNRRELAVAIPDAFAYDLELRLRTNRNEQTHKVRWYGTSPDALPPDLAGLNAELTKIWDGAEKACAGQS